MLSVGLSADDRSFVRLLSSEESITHPIALLVGSPCLLVCSGASGNYSKILNILR